MDDIEQLTEWPCQYLQGGFTKDQVEGLCTHEECHPRDDEFATK